jgi:PEP-CTERM motif
MKKAIVPLALILQCVYLASTSSGQTTVYSDNFAADGSLSSSYLNINSVGQPADAWTFTPDSQLQLQTAGTGKLDDLAGSFGQAITLSSAGQYVTFTVNFNSAGAANGLGQSGTAGLLLFALDNSGGTPLGGGGSSEAESSSATGGQTAGYIGYLGQLSLNTTPKTSTKFYAKTGSGNNDLSYYSDATPDTQIGATEANGYNFSSSDSYTLTYTVAYVSATEDAITTTLFDNTADSQAETFTVDSASASTPTQTLDTFDVGIYTGSESAGYDLNLTSLAITTDVTPVPEPTIMALAGAGLGLLGVMRFRRR